MKEKDEMSTTKPSGVTDVYWVYARSKSRDYPKNTLQSGKWLVFINKKDVDDVWGKIKRATEEGRLGGSAKVSTAKPNPNAVDTDKRVICIYTYDCEDEEDVKRVRQELRKLGITERIPYKTDEATLRGRYQIKGDKKISKYFE